MAVGDYHLEIEGIKGESKVDGFKDQIQLSSFAWSLSNHGTFQKNGGGGQGKSSPGDFSFTMDQCKASPDLMMACANGKHIGKVTFTARKAGEGQKEYLSYTFKDVLVSSYSTSGHGDSDSSEQVTLNFAFLEVNYKEQDNKGTLLGTIRKAYDWKEVKEA